MSKLRELIESQKKDNETDWVPDNTKVGARTITRNVDLSRSEDRSLGGKVFKNGESVLHLMEGCQSWDASKMGEGRDCPICRGKRLRKYEYCLGCDRCGLDRSVERGARSYPGLPVGSHMNEEYLKSIGEDDKPEPTKYVKGKLKGGMGK